MTDRTPELLNRAADVIEARGWNQGGYEGPGGEVCLLGALAVADGLPPDGYRIAGLCTDEEAVRLRDVAQAVHVLTRRLGFHAAAWNDDIRRTAAEVTAAMRDVARDAAEQGGGER